MSVVSDFIRSGSLPDIQYRTVAPEEIISPRVTTRDSVPVVYMHGERNAPNKGFVPAVAFLQRLALGEPNLAVTGYRANGRQTTISFNKSECVTLSPRLVAYLSSLRAKRDGKSRAVVWFLANLHPLYAHEEQGGVWCARSLQDGTVVWPVDESDWDEERGTVRVQWQGDPRRESLCDGNQIATLAMNRYVRLHGAGAAEEAIGAELWLMAEHFNFKTGCSLYLPQLPEPPGRVARAGRVALRWGEGVLVNLFSKLAGAG